MEAVAERDTRERRGTGGGSGSVAVVWAVKVQHADLAARRAVEDQRSLRVRHVLEVCKQQDEDDVAAPSTRSHAKVYVGVLVTDDLGVPGSQYQPLRVGGDGED